MLHPRPELSSPRGSPWTPGGAVRAGGSFGFRLAEPGASRGLLQPPPQQQWQGWDRGLRLPRTGTSGQNPSPSPGCSPEMNGGRYLWRRVCNGPMNFTARRCCGGVRYWVLLLLLKLMPLKSQPSAASPAQRWGEDGDEDGDARAQRAQRPGQREGALGPGWVLLPGTAVPAAGGPAPREQPRRGEGWHRARPRAAAARRVKHCHVLFSPHTSA